MAARRRQPPLDYVVDIGEDVIEAGGSRRDAIAFARRAVNARAGREIVTRGSRALPTRVRAAVAIERTAFDPDYPDAPEKGRGAFFAVWKTGDGGCQVFESSDPEEVNHVRDYLYLKRSDLPRPARQGRTCRV